MVNTLSGAQFSIFFNFSPASSPTSFDMPSSKNKWQFTCIKDCDLVKLQRGENATSFEMWLACGVNLVFSASTMLARN